jgi:20S proteasome subunit alpha 4
MDREETIKLTVKSLLEVVQTGAKNIEIAIIEPGGTLELLSTETIETYVEDINSEKQEEAARKPGRAAGSSSTATAAAAAAATATATLPTRGADTEDP